MRRKGKKNFVFKNNEGTKYEVFFQKPNSAHYGEADGTCSDPEGEHPKIFINPYLTKQSELNTAIHEFTHSFFWEATEKEVYKFANTLSRFLYNYCKWRKLERQGYQSGKVKLEKEKPMPPKTKKRYERRRDKKNNKKP